jgi:nitronate monooxygenase
VTLDTALCSTLGVDVPVVQAPIGSASTPVLAAAVADAGALGTLALSWYTPTEARRVVERTLGLTGGRVAVNLVLDPDTGETPTGELLDAALDAGVELVSLSFGDPTPYVDRVHDAGGSVLATVGSADEAAHVVEAGADVVVAQGWEAGGHVQSEVATLPLVPRVVDAVPADVPVVAAGGIGDGRGLAAVLALGADGGWLGTRFVATAESGAHDRYKRAVAAASEDETVYGEPFPKGWPDQPHRAIANETTEQWESAGRPPLAERSDTDESVARTPDSEPVERYDDLPPLAGMEGDVDALPQYAGQSVGLTDEVVSATAVIDRIVGEAETALARAGDRGGETAAGGR